MDNAEKRNIKNQLYLLESNLAGLAININTLYGFIGEDVRVSIKKEDYGSIVKPTFSQLPKYGDNITLEHWLESVKSGFFTDGDGSGYFSTKDMEATNYPAKPSDTLLPDWKPPAWATHVAWYNK